MERKPDWLPGFPVQIYCNSEDVVFRAELSDYYGIAFDQATDTVYAALYGIIAPLEEHTMGEPQIHALTTIGDTTSSSTIIAQRYVLNEDGDVFLYSLDQGSAAENVLRIAGIHDNDLVSDFARANPDISIQMVNCDMQSLDGLISLLSGGDEVDILLISKPGLFEVLKKKGYVASLSESSLLTTAVDSMHEPIREIVYSDGKIYGYPESM